MKNAELGWNYRPALLLVGNKKAGRNFRPALVTQLKFFKPTAGLMDRLD
jgi:hypothetical protein